MRLSSKPRRVVLFAVLFAAFVISFAVEGFSVRAQGGGNYYVVQPGDTLFSIADRFGVSLSDLATINGVYDVNRVFVGQVLTLPAAIRAPQPQQPIYQPYPSYPQPQPYVPSFPAGTTVTTVTRYVGYTVRRGDNLAAIAEKYKTTIGLIMAANGIANANYIYVGQHLVIPRVNTTISPRPPAWLRRTCLYCPTRR